MKVACWTLRTWARRARAIWLWVAQKGDEKSTARAECVDSLRRFLDRPTTFRPLSAAFRHTHRVHTDTCEPSRNMPLDMGTGKECGIFCRFSFCRRKASRSGRAMIACLMIFGSTAVSSSSRQERPFPKNSLLNACLSFWMITTSSASPSTATTSVTSGRGF